MKKIKKKSKSIIFFFFSSEFFLSLSLVQGSECLVTRTSEKRYSTDESRFQNRNPCFYSFMPDAKQEEKMKMKIKVFRLLCRLEFLLLAVARVSRLREVVDKFLANVSS